MNQQSQNPTNEGEESPLCLPEENYYRAACAEQEEQCYPNPDALQNSYKIGKDIYDYTYGALPDADKKAVQQELRDLPSQIEYLLSSLS